MNEKGKFAGGDPAGVAIGLLVAAVFCGCMQLSPPSDQAPLVDREAFYLEVEGEGDEYLQGVANEHTVPFCQDSEARSAGLGLASALFRFVPVVGQLVTIVDAANAVGVASVCQGGDGQLAFTWEQIMEEVDQRIAGALDDAQRQRINDLLGHLLLQFEGNRSLLNAIDQADPSQDSPEAIENAIREGLIRAADMRFAAGQLEAEFNSLSNYTSMPVLAEIAALKHAVVLILIDLNRRLDGFEDNDIVIDDFLNVQSELERKASVLALTNMEGKFDAFHDNASLFRQTTTNSASGGNGVFTFTYTVKARVRDIRDVLDQPSKLDAQCSRSNVSSNSTCPSASVYYARFADEFALARETFTDELTDLNSTVGDDYYDLFASLSALKGRRFFIVSGDGRCLSASAPFPYDLELVPCSFDAGTGVVTDPDGASDIWRLHDKTGLVINEKEGQCLDRGPSEFEFVALVSECRYDLDAQAPVKDSQQWGFHPAGPIVSRVEDNQLCLAEQFNPNLPVDTFVGVEPCDLGATKSEMNLGFSVPDARVDDRSQRWQLKYVDCSAGAGCVVTDDPPVNNGSDPAENQVRHVLAADQIGGFQGQASLKTVTGFTDSGFLSMAAAGDRATWSGQEIIKGTYRMTVYQQGPSSNGSGTRRIQVLVNGAQIPTTPGDALPFLASGVKGTVEFEIDLPEFGATFAIEAVDGKNYLIDKVVLTPIP